MRERKNRARERCLIFPLRKNAWTSFFFYMVENARLHEHMFITGVFEGTLVHRNLL